MKQFFTVLVVLVLVVGGGGFLNYQRNAPLDQELQDRPFERFSDADLKALLEAHTLERDRIRGVLSKKSSDPTQVMNGFKAADFDGKVHAFDKFQKKNSAYKQVNRVALEHDVEIDRVKKEQNIRARGLHTERQRIIRRVTTF